jgi:uncharacterized protein YjbI with pentapeptide repeats
MKTSSTIPDQTSSSNLQDLEQQSDYLKSIERFITTLMEQSESRGGIVFGNEVSNLYLTQERSATGRKLIAIERAIIEKNSIKNELYIELQYRLKTIFNALNIADGTNIDRKTINGEGAVDKIGNLFKLAISKAPTQFGADEATALVGMVADHSGDKKFHDYGSKLVNLQGDGTYSVAAFVECLARKIVLDQDLLLKVKDEIAQKEDQQKKENTIQKLQKKIKHKGFRERLTQTQLSDPSSESSLITIMIITSIFDCEELAEKIAVDTDLVNNIHHTLRDNLDITRPLLPLRGIKKEDPNSQSEYFTSKFTKVELQQLQEELKLRIKDLDANIKLLKSGIDDINARLEKIDQDTHDTKEKVKCLFDQATKKDNPKTTLKYYYTKIGESIINEFIQDQLETLIKQQISRLSTIDSELSGAINSHLTKPTPESTQLINNILINKQYTRQFHEPSLPKHQGITKHNIELLRLFVKTLSAITVEDARKIGKGFYQKLPDSKLRIAFLDELELFGKENHVLFDIAKNLAKIAVASSSYKDAIDQYQAKRKFKIGEHIQITITNDPKLAPKELTSSAKDIDDKKITILAPQEIISTNTGQDEQIFDGTRESNTKEDMNWKQKILDFTEELPESLQLQISNNQPLKLPKGRILVSIPNIGNKLLKEDIARQIFNEDGKFQNSERYGQRDVKKVSDDQGRSIHFKLNPEFPGVEKAAERLALRVTGGNIARTQLMRFINDQAISIPVLASDTIEEENLQERLVLDADLEKNPDKIFRRRGTLETLQGLNRKNFSQLFLLGLLFTPEDAKPDNYILKSGELSLIDNDRCFFPAIALEGTFIKTEELQLKNFLFCMDQMQKELDEEVIEEFLKFSPRDLLIEWLRELRILNQSYLEIFTPYEITKYYEEKEPIILSAFFRPDLIEDLFNKIKDIQALLRRDQERKSLLSTPTPIRGYSHLDLFTRVESKAGREYKKLFEIFPNNPDQPENQLARWKIIEKKHYKITEKGAVSGTVSKRMVKTAQIKNKQDLLDLVRGKAANSPEAMANFFSETELDVDKQVKNLRAGNTKEFQESFSSSNQKIKRRIIDQIRFDDPTITNDNKLKIIKAIQDVEFINLNLKGSDQITYDLLLPILRSGGESLKSINLSNCLNITQKTLDNIAYYCPNIEEIEMSNLPNITEIKEVTFLFTNYNFPNLRRIDLSNCCNLTDIYLDAPKLEEIKVEGCNKLRKNLDLREKELIAKNVESVVVKRLRYNHSVVTLDLSNNNIGATGAEALAAVLEKSSLTSLDLNNNQIGDKGAEYLADVLEKSSLTSLNLRYNKIDYEGAEALAAVLEKSILTSLDLGFNHIGATGAEALAAVLEKSSLTSLDLGFNYIGAKVAEALAAVLEKSSLTSLDLRDNYIGAKEAEVLAAVLEKSSLTSLDLRENNIGDKGAEYLADVLEKSSLTSLNLRDNNIGAKGAEVLAAVLEKSSLTSLNLRYNNIGAKGAEALAAVLEKSSLTSLDLRDNNIGAKGAEVLAAVLEKSSLTSLDLMFNNIGDQLESKISKFIAQNCEIRDDFIALAKNVAIGTSSKEALLEKMRELAVGHQLCALIEIIK